MKMKVGDSRQAILLGVVAVAAIGFLIKTAVGSFMGKVSNAPMVVKDLRGGDAPKEAATSPSKDVSPQESIPAPTQAIDSHPTSGPYFIRDAFAKIPPKEPAGTATNHVFTSPVDPREYTNDDVGDGKPTLPDAQPQAQGMAGSIGGSSPDSMSKTQEAPQKESLTIRFDGFVDAGSPMAVLTYKGATYTVSPGDPVADGIVVEMIWSDKVLLRKDKKTIRVLVGKEVEIK